jgi:DNA-binding transcriptional ArsR family regulator
MRQKEGNDPPDIQLHGTTYRVYRYMIKRRQPVGVSQVQKELGLSSSSVSEYHLKKLLEMGLIRKEQEGYEIDKVVLDNIIRLNRLSIPIEAAYVTFFLATLVILVLVLRPDTLNSVYFFALVVNCSALIIFAFEAMKTMRRI